MQSSFVLYSNPLRFKRPQADVFVAGTIDVESYRYLAQRALVSSDYLASHMPRMIALCAITPVSITVTSMFCLHKDCCWLLRWVTARSFTFQSLLLPSSFPRPHPHQPTTHYDFTSPQNSPYYSFMVHIAEVIWASQ